MPKYVAIVASFLLGSAAQASSETGSHILSYTAQPSGQFFLNTDGNRAGVPGCSTQKGRWVIDATSAGGQATVAAMLTAYALHKTLNVYGTNDCTIWGDTESVLFMTAY